MRADRWFQDSPGDDDQHRESSSHIGCNILKQAKDRENRTHRLAGEGTHNLGYYAFEAAFLWYEILHGDIGQFGTYSLAQILPDKIARFLFEFHASDFQTLGLPAFPDDRSQMDSHHMLDVFQVRHFVKNFAEFCRILKNFEEF